MVRSRHRLPFNEVDMKTILLCTTALLIAGCAVPVKPLCNREAQEWNKFNTSSDVCVDTPLVVTARDKDSDSVTPAPDKPTTVEDNTDDNGGHSGNGSSSNNSDDENED